MTFDFGTLSGNRPFESLTSPRDIFNALPRKQSYFEYLRDGQGRVLDHWESRRTERDLIIKVNTGGGKTVVGLLILQASLNEGAGPALYVAPDTYLASQVRRQAADLGLETVEDPDVSAYIAGKAIAVINVHKLINGMSVFGGPGSSRLSPLKIGTVIVDDVHAALATAEDQCTIRLPVSHAIYSFILERFRNDLEGQAPNTLLALKEGDPSVSPMLVPFWAWRERSAEMASVFQSNKEDENIKWIWPLIRDHLSLCRCAIGPRGLEIRPPCLPIGDISSFRSSLRRVFLTATLADDSVLIGAFDARPDSVAAPITPDSASDLGDRMILAPQQINPQISEDEIKWALAELSRDWNTVVIVPSTKRAAYWGDVAKLVAAGDRVSGAVDQLQAGHVGLIVFVNKYDGIDLPDAACRILVLDALPEVYGLLDRRDAAVLSDSESLFDRQMQRIEQGMGRGVRGANDHCVVVLLGHRLTQRIASPGLRQQFSNFTQAQLGLSTSLTERLEGASIADIVGVMKQSLERDAGWLTVSKQAVAGIKYSSGHVSASAVAQRQSFNLSATQQYVAAVGELSLAANSESDDGIWGLLKEQIAAYTDFYDRTAAQQTLAGALGRNPRILRPLQGFSYKRLSAHANQASAVATYLGSRYDTAGELLLGIRAVLDDLVFDPDGTSTFETAMEELGCWLGFQAQRPERDSGNGPDVLWSLGELQYLVIECKSGVTTDEISRKSIQQLSHSMDWFREAYDATCNARPVLVHPTRHLAQNASAPENTRVITREHLEKLRTGVAGFVQALASDGTWVKADAIAPRLQTHQLSAGQFPIAYAVPPQH
jgi:hypothetical protein